MNNNAKTLPVELFLQIVESSDLDSVLNLCQTNKLFNKYCKNNRDYISKYFLNKYRVDWQDEGNLIYLNTEQSKISELIVKNDYYKLLQ